MVLEDCDFIFMNDVSMNMKMEVVNVLVSNFMFRNIANNASNIGLNVLINTFQINSGVCSNMNMTMLYSDIEPFP